MTPPTPPSTPGPVDAGLEAASPASRPKRPRPSTPPAPKSLPRPPGKRPGFVGPLFRWELVRLARRGQDARARFILAISLLFILTLFTVAWFPHTPPRELFFGTSQVLSLEDSARFAQQFSLTFVLAQLAVIVFITPAYAAGGISEEKERKTFIYLLVSDLTNREILLGKFLGRLVFLLGIMLSGLPILALTLLFGGVSFTFLLMAYLITAATVTMSAAISAAAAAATATYRGALFRGYGFTALHMFVGFGAPYFSPFAIIGLLSTLEGDSNEVFWLFGLGYAAAEFAAAVFAIWLGIRWIRQSRSGLTNRPGRSPRRRYPHIDRAPPVLAVVPPEQLLPEDEIPIELPLYDDSAPDSEKLALESLPTAALIRVAPAVPPPPPAPVPRRYRRPETPPARRPFVPPDVARRPKVPADDPFLWKERYSTGLKRDADDDSIRGVLIAVGIMTGIVAGMLILISAMTLTLGGNSSRSGAAGLLLFVGAGGMFTYLLTVGAAAGGTIVRERQRNTLESLLSIPVDRRAILWPKWVVCIDRGWWWGILATASLPIGFLASDVPLVFIPTLVYAAAAVPLTASLGLWLSIRCRTQTRAVLWLLPAIGGAVVFLLVVWQVSGAEDQFLATAAVGIMAVAMAAAAWLFWNLTFQAFEREGRE
ncbi:ABC transporter permease [Fimbriiglobus ruber]|uniref:ABC-2 family transporter protein n=1 Tax=Fimbriiglobus ruber TaxID=1908690 RepID=A0A225DE61_9BACT|nr:ABC transporter permease subunit [Fimbriiglobus ruber]OWK37924.1 hypothetical protein FRUB_07044 [Fimbriiglobus ruber]